MIGNVEYDIWFMASELPNSDIEIEVVEPERSDYDKQFSMGGGFDLPSAYELSIDLTDMQDIQQHPSSRYGAAEIETTLSEIPTLDDVEDIVWTDVSTEYSGDVDDEVTLSTSVSSSDVIGFRYVVDENDEIVNQMVTTAGGGGAPPLSGGNGIMSTIYGWGAALLSGVVVAFAAVKRYVGNAVGQ
jgi:hypothetical protein